VSRIKTLLVHEDGHSGELAAMLEPASEIELVGQAPLADGPSLVARLRPRVVLLACACADACGDVIERVMAQSPTAILVLAPEPVAGDATERVLGAGAVDLMPLPDPRDEKALAALRRRVEIVSRVQVITHIRGRLPGDGHRVPIVAIAASTGGPQALTRLLSTLHGLEAPVLVVQHLHPDFVVRFVQWLARHSALPVELATAGAQVRNGTVYLAPANRHLKLDTARRLALDPEPRSLHRPSADVLFDSVAMQAGAMGVGVLLTGMGDDGAAGLLAIRRAGGHTIVQDEASSAVFGMPQAAERLGAAEQVLPLERIPEALLAFARRTP
jgi:two-component system, chemotaxis family, protein-glutamate methylesterase/glutaminase